MILRIPLWEQPESSQLLPFCFITRHCSCIISKRSGNTGDEIRSQSGELAAYVLENIQGLDETVQYGNGKSRMDGMNRKTQQLTENQRKLNKLTGFNLALANTFILVFDIAMRLLSAHLYSKGITDFSGFIIPLIALISSYGPVSALANLGTTLQSTVYKKHLKSFVEKKGMLLKTKVSILTTVTFLMSFGVFMMARKGIWIPCIIIGVVWVCHVIYFVFGVKTIKSDDLAQK